MTALTEALEYETAEQRAERIQEWRLWKALQDAPELFTHARAITISGRIERGDEVPHMHSPMKITTEDDASERYARLAEWVDNFAQDLNIAPPVARVAARRIENGDIQGFRAHVTPEGAGILVNLLTAWLTIHQERISTHPAYLTYREDVTGFLRDMSKKYPVDRGREKPVHPRPCPECGMPAIRAEWWSENTADVNVECTFCGYTVPPTDYAKILRWVLE